MKSRDQLVWGIVDNKRQYPYVGLHGVRNYTDLGDLARRMDWDLAWSTFLHNFYSHRDPRFFEERVPAYFLPEWQAYVAAATEFLCLRYGYPIPAWAYDPIYRLPHPWTSDMFSMASNDELRQRVADSPDPFRRRNVIAGNQSLIVI